MSGVFPDNYNLGKVEAAFSTDASTSLGKKEVQEVL